MVPQNNFRPTGDGQPELMYRDALEEAFVIKAESCYRCGINCHKNVYERKADGSRGAFRAKFDYEPLNLLSTNAGVHDPDEVWPLVALVDHLGMDSISCSTTIDYVLDYNARHPDAPVFNGATFGDADKIRELIEQVGTGQLPELGHGSKRLSEQLGETAYAMHCKGLELPAYVPDTNPGYPFAIAGGHMSMATYMLVAMEGNTSPDYWVQAITERGLLMVRDDLLGVCKFAGLNAEMAARCLEDEIGLRVTQAELLAAVRRAFIRALWLERKQGYTRDDYTMPAQVFDNPNPAIKAEPFVTREFFATLSDRVWEIFDKEIASLPPVPPPSSLNDAPHE
jgi:aldehyde:ferredoxin oxidoreductase